MFRKILLTITLIASVLMLTSCTKTEPAGKFTGAKGEVKIITLDPGHFHAALIQKIMYDQVSPMVHVYAPDGPDVADHLKRIEGFNTRSENPTTWKEVTYTGDDFVEKMIEEKLGNVVVISGNNKKKTQYIKACVDAGLNVLADKPMCISPQDFDLLKEAFVSAKNNGVFIYDIMTERSSITTILQKELSIDKSVFGDLQVGSVDDPAVISESVHHFFKYVAGNPIKRPKWYFDTTQQGEGIVDVTVHLTDLIMWATFPDKIIDYKKDVEILEAKRWPTLIKLDQYKKVTHLNDLKAFPDFLKSSVNDDGVLECYGNGSITYKLNGIVAQATVEWRYQAPEGTKDTHFALMRGSKCDLVIRQGKDQNYKPELYVEAAKGQDAGQLEAVLKTAVKGLQGDWPGVAVVKEGDLLHVTVPDKYRIGHEAHFGQVTERFLQYLVDGKLPEWEVPNMTAKYYTTTTALKMAGK
jgi:predicted dehydrogenase